MANATDIGNVCMCVQWSLLRIWRIVMAESDLLFHRDLHLKINQLFILFRHYGRGK